MSSCFHRLRVGPQMFDAELESSTLFSKPSYMHSFPLTVSFLSSFQTVRQVRRPDAVLRRRRAPGHRVRAHAAGDQGEPGGGGRGGIPAR